MRRMKQLSPADRMRLLKFVCSFAWTDLRISDEERAFVRDLVARLELDQAERIEVARWLNSPPTDDGIDPTTIPAEHRRLFVEAARGILEADGVAVVEHEGFQLFEELAR
jgi:hypothetical protein